MKSTILHQPSLQIEKNEPEILANLSSEEIDNSLQIVEDREESADSATAKSKIDPLFFEYAKSKSLKIRNELIKRNTPLVSFIITKFYGNDKSLIPIKEDLMQEGLIGLMSAIEGYKPELGFRFSTYSTWWIRQAVNNFILNIEPTIHIPSHVRIAKTKLHRKLSAENAILQEYIGDHNKQPKTDEPELSARMLQSISRASQAKNIVSFDEPCKSGEGSLADTIPSDKETNTELLFDGASVYGLVRSALSKLSEKERLVLMLRFDIIKNG